MNLSQYFALEKLLDQEGIRDKIFLNYKNMSVKSEREENHLYKNYDKILAEYKELTVDREGYRNKYKDAIFKVLNDVLTSKSDILIFPEYTIPSFIYDEMRRYPVENECIIVAGSHITEDDDWFNVCPVFFNKTTGEKEIYHYYKNNLSPFEEKLELAKNRGTAYLKFLNTACGNLYVQICYDVFTVSALRGFEKVDVLLVPSFNPSIQFKNSIEIKANEYKLVAAYTNTINEGEIKSNFFVPIKEGLTASLRGIEPFHKDQWSEGEKEPSKAKAPIFNLSPEQDEWESKEIEGFNFKIKHLMFDIIQLDLRRKIKSMS